MNGAGFSRASRLRDPIADSVNTGYRVPLKVFGKRMKYAIVILEGAADRPCRHLDGLTPLQAARTPTLDQLARAGRVGAVSLTPHGFAPSPDIAALTLLGYDARQVAPGWGGLEAAAFGIQLGPEDWALRADLVTLDEDGVLVDHTAGRISAAETAALFQSLASALPAEFEHDVDDLEFFPIGAGATLMVDRGCRDYRGVETAPPWESLGRLTVRYEPRGGAVGRLLRDLMYFAADHFSEHEINLTRREMSEREASMPWFWGEGRAAALAPFGERFLRGRPMSAALVGGASVVKGIATAIGWEWLDIESSTGRDDRGVSVDGSLAVDAIDDYDLVVAHDDSPRTASHDGDLPAKVEAIERADRDLIGPLVEKLRRRYENDWRLLVTAGPAALVEARTLADGGGGAAGGAASPILIAGAHISGVTRFDSFNEINAHESDLKVISGADFIEYFLLSGASGWREPAG